MIPAVPRILLVCPTPVTLRLWASNVCSSRELDVLVKHGHPADKISKSPFGLFPDRLATGAARTAADWRSDVVLGTLEQELLGLCRETTVR